MKDLSTTYYCPLCGVDVGKKPDLEDHIGRVHRMLFSGHDDMVRRMQSIGFSSDDFTPKPKKPKETT